jgi:hypothetical protein
MKRNLIALAVSLGFAATAAVAEPTLEFDTKDRVLNAPEMTSYQADTQAAGVRATEQDEGLRFNP